MRIAKYIANAGLCSRREAEKLITKKKVFINNIVCEKPNVNVTVNDKIEVNKKLLSLNNKIQLWKLYKPTKVICTNHDPKKRKTIFDILPKKIPRLISIGRLDYMSEGLILLTNKGDFARKLELPSSNFLRVYRVYIKGKINNKDIEKINLGISINKINYKKIFAIIERESKGSTWIKFKLREGKNREIRNICEYFKWNIMKLIRVQFGSIKIKKEKPGQIEKIDIIPKDFL